jgi:DNA mismatch repair protein MutL
MPIQVLDQGTINKIAAGEVIERPASVVKELVENAIDAKATAITIEIKDGGISFIRVTDNGCGIDKSELPIAFLRHSTSKIKSVEDLLCVSSLGFRGEALSSIAAVAQVELITKPKSAFAGCRYVIEGGREAAIEEIGAPDGTTFIVRNLFYNTPVRRKFLKTAVTEAGYVSSVVEHMALSHPDISFRFINNNQNKLHTSGNDNLKDIIYHIYGRDVAGNLLPVKGETQDVTIDGYVGKPLLCRGNRTYENYFINGRYIKSNIIAKALEEAYKGFIMLHQYPYSVLHLTINPQIMDVNVHPTKMELRFSRNELVYDFVYNAVRDALTHKELIPEVRVDSGAGAPKKTAEATEKPKVSLPEPFEVNRIQRMKEQEAQAKQNEQDRQEAQAKQNEQDRQEAQAKQNVQDRQEAQDKQNVQEPCVVAERARQYASAPQGQVAKEEPAMTSDEPANVQQMTLFGEDKKFMDAANKPNYRLIGQLFDTYWLMEYDEKLFIMDQHAAHEKILYEKTMRLLGNNEMTTQMVNPPIILTLNMRELEVLKANRGILEGLGYEMEDFGGNEVKVTGIPATLPTLDERGLLMEILDSLVDENLKGSPETITMKAASMSCKAAVKGNMHMSYTEADRLVEQLMQAENPYNCPHGRPTLISISKYELEKKFKRIV